MSHNNFLSDVSFRVSCRSLDLGVPGTAGILESVEVEVPPLLLPLVEGTSVKVAYSAVCFVLRWFFKEVVAEKKNKIKFYDFFYLTVFICHVHTMTTCGKLSKHVSPKARILYYFFYSSFHCSFVTINVETKFRKCPYFDESWKITIAYAMWTAKRHNVSFVTYRVLWRIVNE